LIIIKKQLIVFYCLFITLFQIYHVNGASLGTTTETYTINNTVNASNGNAIIPSVGTGSYNRIADCNFQEFYDYSTGNISEFLAIESDGGLKTLQVIDKNDYNETLGWFDSRALEIQPSLYTARVYFWPIEQLDPLFYNYSTVFMANSYYTNFIRVGVNGTNFETYSEMVKIDETRTRLRLYDSSGSYTESGSSFTNDWTYPVWVSYSYLSTTNISTIKFASLYNISNVQTLTYNLGNYPKTDFKPYIEFDGFSIQRTAYVYAFDGNTVLHYVQDSRYGLAGNIRVNPYDFSYNETRILQLYQTDKNSYNSFDYQGVYPDISKTSNMNSSYSETSEQLELSDKDENSTLFSSYSNISNSGDFKRYNNYSNNPTGVYEFADYTDSSNGSNSIVEVSEYAGRTGLLGLSDNSATDYTSATITDTQQDSENIVFSVYKNSMKNFTIQFGDDVSNCIYLLFNNSAIQYYNGTDFYNLTNYTTGIWYDFYISYDITDSWNVWINGTLYGKDLTYLGSLSAMDYVNFSTIGTEQYYSPLISDLHFGSASEIYDNEVGIKEGTIDWGTKRFLNMNPLENDYGYYDIIDENQYSNVLRINDSSAGGYINQNIPITPMTAGYFNLNIKYETNGAIYFGISDGGIGNGIWLRFYGGFLSFYTVSWSSLGFASYDEWHNIKISFDLSSYSLIIDYGSVLTPIPFYGTPTEFDQFNIRTDSAKTGLVWMDRINIISEDKEYFEFANYDYDSYNLHVINNTLVDNGPIVYDSNVNTYVYADYQDLSGAGCSLVNVGTAFGRTNSISLSDNNVGARATAYIDYNQNLTQGMIYFSLWQIDYKYFNITIGDSYDNAIRIGYNDTSIEYYDGTYHNITNYLEDSWYDFRIYYEIDFGWSLWINETFYGNYSFLGNLQQIDYINFSTSIAENNNNPFLSNLSFCEVFHSDIGRQYEFSATMGYKLEFDLNPLYQNSFLLYTTNGTENHIKLEFRDGYVFNYNRTGIENTTIPYSNGSVFTVYIEACSNFFYLYIEGYDNIFQTNGSNCNISYIDLITNSYYQNNLTIDLAGYNALDFGKEKPLYGKMQALELSFIDNDERYSDIFTYKKSISENNFVLGTAFNLPYGNWTIELVFDVFTIRCQMLYSGGWNVLVQILWDLNTTNLLASPAYTSYNDNEVVMGIGNNSIFEKPYWFLRIGGIKCMNGTLDTSIVPNWKEHTPYVNISNYNYLGHNATNTSKFVFKGIFEQTPEYVELDNPIYYNAKVIVYRMKLENNQFYNIIEPTLPATYKYWNYRILLMNISQSLTLSNYGNTIGSYLEFSNETIPIGIASNQLYEGLYLFNFTQNSNFAVNISREYYIFNGSSYTSTITLEVQWTFWFDEHDLSLIQMLAEWIAPSLMFIIFPYAFYTKWGPKGAMLGFIFGFIVFGFSSLIDIKYTILLVLSSVLMATIIIKNKGRDLE